MRVDSIYSTSTSTTGSYRTFDTYIYIYTFIFYYTGSLHIINGIYCIYEGSKAKNRNFARF